MTRYTVESAKGTEGRTLRAAMMKSTSLADRTTERVLRESFWRPVASGAHPAREADVIDLAAWKAKRAGR